MSNLAIAQTKTALSPNLTASFLASNGTAPYTYSVLPGGAGGTINLNSGVYTAPNSVPADPALLYDTIQAQDTLGILGTAQILVGTPLLLFCEIIQNELGLANGRVFLWDQKIFQPTDNGLYVAVSVISCKPFSNNTKPLNGDWGSSVQETNFLATLDINAISRDASALNRKEEIVLTFNSIYAQSQQEANSFYIGKLPPGTRFTNLSIVDGAAIPYRYQISVNLQYAVTKSSAISYFNVFQTSTVTTNP